MITLGVNWLLPYKITINATLKFQLLILQADTDKDGRLTLTEMIDNPYVFYSAVFNEDEDDDDDYAYHDEFR